VQFFGNLATLMEVEIDTGKTHQIRVHAAHAGHPVAGDDKYGNRVFNQLFEDYGLKRMFLHSSSLGFTRPGTREPMLASAPLPTELSAVIDKLTRGKARAPQDERGKTLKPEGSRGPVAVVRVQRPTPIPRAGKPRMGKPGTGKTGASKPGSAGKGPAKVSGPVRGEGRRRARTTGGL